MANNKSVWAFRFVIQILWFNVKVPCRGFIFLTFLLCFWSYIYLRKPHFCPTTCHHEINKLWLWNVSWHVQDRQKRELSFPQWNSILPIRCPHKGKRISYQKPVDALGNLCSDDGSTSLGDTPLRCGIVFYSLLHHLWAIAFNKGRDTITATMFQ